MGFLQAIGSGFRNYATFSGRASRSEYWWWILFTFLAGFVLGFAENFFLSMTYAMEHGGALRDGQSQILSSFFSLATFLPSLAVMVRRLHDVGRSGIWVAIPWILTAAMLLGVMMAGIGGVGLGGTYGNAPNPQVGTALVIGAGIANLVVAIRLFFWMIKRGTRGENPYGPDPLDGNDDYVEQYSASNIPAHARGAGAPTQAANHRDEIHALYQQRVLGKQG